jgi:uncharacterized protein YjbJ (UPF0337 family)
MESVLGEKNQEGDFMNDHKNEDVEMNEDILAGRWKQIRGKAKQWWGDLTDDEMDQIAGKRDILVGKLQERYGYTKERAETEIDRFLEENVIN